MPRATITTPTCGNQTLGNHDFPFVVRTTAPAKDLGLPMLSRLYAITHLLDPALLQLDTPPAPSQSAHTGGFETVSM